jgi:hypothetical protein
MEQEFTDVIKRKSERRRGVSGKEGESCGCRGQQSSRGGKIGAKINILNENNFLRLTYFKLLSQTEGKSINNCDFF